MQIAKKPEKNYVLQESKTVTEKTSITTVNSNRNPRIIAGITSTSGTTVTVTSELPHKLSVKDKVRIKGAYSTRNLSGVGNTGFNGEFEVISVPNTKTFTYSNPRPAGAFMDKLQVHRAIGVGGTLPVFERLEYDTTYTIQEVETVQEYEQGEQDGIYYLTCLIGNINPTVEPFDTLSSSKMFLNCILQ